MGSEKTVMAYSDERPTNWGCIVATPLAVLGALFVMLYDMMAGGGCEGETDTCVPDYSDKWMMLGGLAIGTMVLAKSVNWLRDWNSNRRSDR